MERSDSAEPNGLIVLLARHLRFVGQKWKRKLVLFVSLSCSVDRFGKDRNDVGSMSGKLLTP
ncbi:hypothetical protein CV102_14465 [Natronococcus pandeyae]|uniref:Uncharacterized protein n=1 Tax=Natronococcus pandeyae TaxID=2055836 RepID=A0A8J8Q3R3_9EURY|nr:hypothetical protein CV102_14465 [Natronococcus pandeyae]